MLRCYRLVEIPQHARFQRGQPVNAYNQYLRLEQEAWNNNMLCSPEALLQKTGFNRHLAALSGDTQFENLSNWPYRSTVHRVSDRQGYRGPASRQSPARAGALTLFTQEIEHPLPQAAQDDLNERVNALGV